MLSLHLRREAKVRAVRKVKQHVTTNFTAGFVVYRCNEA